MRAAINISHGYVDKKGEPHRVEIVAGQEIPEAFLGDIPDNLILEEIASNNPESLTRAQLMVLAGITESPEDMAPIEYDEDKLREALSELRTKAELIDWFGTVRPASEQPDPAWKRDEIVDYIIEEMVGEYDEE